MLSTTRSHRTIAFALVASGTIMFTAAGPAGPQSLPPPVPARVAEMQHHFIDVSIIHEAIIRGELPATVQAAARLSTLPNPERMPDSSLRFVEAIRLAGRRIVQAPTLENATVEVTRMLRQCGSCHQSMSVYPPRRTPTGPDVGGIVGHMLEHRRALDDLLLGLVVPSDGRWREGAMRLRTAAMRPDDWPPPAELPIAIRQADVTVHELAAEALRATSPLEQAPVYSKLLLTCASCHGLHARIWGPKSQ
jgi:hypothetical protein